MNWDTGTWESGVWDAPPLSDYFLSSLKPKKQNHKMKRQTYYRSRIGDQVIWLDNFAQKLPIHGPTCGVSSVAVVLPTLVDGLLGVVAGAVVLAAVTLAGRVRGAMTRA